MEPIVLNIKDQGKYLSFLQFIRQLDFVEVERPAKKRSVTEKYNFFASAGLWEGKDINAKTLRTKAWNRQK
jgi:hypothetical protein